MDGELPLSLEASVCKVLGNLEMDKRLSLLAVRSWFDILQDQTTSQGESVEPVLLNADEKGGYRTIFASCQHTVPL